MSTPENCHIRNQLRQTWLRDSSPHLAYKFLLDKASEALRMEQEIFGDLIFVNAHWTGKAKRFGEKLYHWFEIARKFYPDFPLIGKADDDIFVCPEHLMRELRSLPTDQIEKLYFGWEWFKQKPFYQDPDMRLNCSTEEIRDDTEQTCYFGQINNRVRMDEFFVILGRATVDKVLSWPYCRHPNPQYCKEKKMRWDTNYGGSSLGLWLGDIQNEHAGIHGFSSYSSNPVIDIVRSQKKIVEKSDKVLFVDNLVQVYKILQNRTEEGGHNRPWNFCRDHFVFHKANTTVKEVL